MIIDLVGFRDRLVTYRVSGKSIGELEKSMEERTISPNGFYAYTLHHCYCLKSRRGYLIAYQIIREI